MFWGKGFMLSRGFATLLKVVGKLFYAKPLKGRQRIKDVAQNMEVGLRAGEKGVEPQAGEKGDGLRASEKDALLVDLDGGAEGVGG